MYWATPKDLDIQSWSKQLLKQTANGGCWFVLSLVKIRTSVSRSRFLDKLSWYKTKSQPSLEHLAQVVLSHLKRYYFLLSLLFFVGGRSVFSKWLILSVPFSSIFPLWGLSFVDSSPSMLRFVLSLWRPCLKYASQSVDANSKKRKITIKRDSQG